MSQIKTLLKEAKIALYKEDYTTGEEFALEVLQHDPNNYYGYILISHLLISKHKGTN